MAKGKRQTYSLNLIRPLFLLQRRRVTLVLPDMEFVQKFTPPDFQAKNFTPSISPNFNSFSGQNTKNE